MSKVAKSALGLMIVTLLSKVIGFLRETVLVSVHGASAIADAYITALNIPIVVFTIIGTALATTFIPLFFEVEKEEGKDNALKFANNIANIVIIISIIISTLGCIYAEPITKIFAMDFTGEKLQIATSFTKIMIWGMLFSGLSYMMTAWLQIKNNFVIPGMIGFPYNVFIITGIFISANGDLKILGILSLVAMASQFLFQVPFAFKSGFRYRPYLNLKDKYLRRMLILVAPVCIGVGVNQLNTVIDRTLASTLGDGVITILNGANKLNYFVMGIFISTISAIVYPMLSKLSTSDKSEDFVNTLKTSLNSVMIIMLPISVGAIILAEPIVRIIFERGKFTPQDTYMTAIALSCYAVGMMAFGLRDILNQIFYSLKDTKTPMINGTFSVILNIILNLILIKVLGYKGLAIATSIAAIFSTFILFNSLKKKINYFGQDKIIKTFVKLIAAVGVMGITTKISYSFLSSVSGSGTLGDIISVFGSVLLSAIVYGLILILLKVEEIDMILSMIKGKLNKKSNNKAIVS